MVSKTCVRLDPGGAYKVGDTRVSLDSIVYAWLQGSTAESVQEQYPAVTLEEVHGAIAFYLANREEVDLYLKQRNEQWQKLRAEQDRNPPAVVQRLRALRAAQQAQG